MSRTRTAYGLTDPARPFTFIIVSCSAFRLETLRLRHLVLRFRRLKHVASLAPKLQSPLKSMTTVLRAAAAGGCS